MHRFHKLTYNNTVRLGRLKKIGVLVMLIVFAEASSAKLYGQSGTNRWLNSKGEVVFSYTINCTGPLYPGSAFNRWEVSIKNVSNKDAKCEVSIIQSEAHEVSEAIAIEIPSKKDKTVIFLKVDIDCSHNGTVFFNRTSFKKSKTL